PNGPMSQPHLIRYYVRRSVQVRSAWLSFVVMLVMARQLSCNISRCNLTFRIFPLPSVSGKHNFPTAFESRQTSMEPPHGAIVLPTICSMKSSLRFIGAAQHLGSFTWLQ